MNTHTHTKAQTLEWLARTLYLYSVYGGYANEPAKPNEQTKWIYRYSDEFNQNHARTNIPNAHTQTHSSRMYADSVCKNNTENIWSMSIHGYKRNIFVRELKYEWERVNLCINPMLHSLRLWLYRVVNGNAHLRPLCTQCRHTHNC